MRLIGGRDAWDAINGGLSSEEDPPLFVDAKTGRIIENGRPVMPFRSKAQMRKFAVMEARREVPKGTFKKWKEHTPKGGKGLPARKKRSK